MNSLQHHGVKGMKWGVRRYQNKDGTYTKRGLEKYKKSEANYNLAKEKLANAKGTGIKADVKAAKGELKVAKRQLNKSYDQLVKDHKADQGRELYRKGESIVGNNRSMGKRQLAVAIGASVVPNILARYGQVKYAYIARQTIAIGGTAANMALTNSTNQKLKAYYSRSRNYQG